MSDSPDNPFENNQDEDVITNPELNIWEALIPVFALILMLAYNIHVYGGDSLSGSSQFILLLSAGVARGSWVTRCISCLLLHNIFPPNTVA